MKKGFILVYFIIVVGVYLFCGGLTARSDGIVYYAMAEALANGKLSLEDEMYLDPYLSRRSLGLPYSENLKIANPYYPGFTLVYYPVFKIADSIKNTNFIKSNDLLFSTVSRIPYRHIVLVWGINLLLLFLSFIFLHLLLKKFFSLQDNIIAMILLMLFVSTSWIYYGAFDFLFLHNIEIFLASAFLLFWSTCKFNSKIYYLVSGIIFSLIISVRVINVFLFLLFILYSIIQANVSGNKKASLAKAVFLFIVGIVPVTSFLMYYSFRIFGSIISTGYPFHLLVWSMPLRDAVAGFLARILFYFIHPVRGLFIWHPILLLSLIGIVLCCIDRKFKMLISGSLILFTLILSQYNAWWGGTCYGQRYYLVCIPFFAVGLGALCKKNIKLFIVPLALCTLYSSALLVMYLGNCNKGAGEFYTPLTLVQNAVANPQLLINSFSANTFRSPYNAYHWIITKIRRSGKAEPVINHAGPVTEIKIRMSDTIQNHKVRFVVHIYLTKEKGFPRDFLLSLWSDKITIENRTNELELNHFGFPSPYISLLLNGNSVPIANMWINYNNMLSKTEELVVMVGAEDTATGTMLFMHELVNKHGYDLAANSFTKKALPYDRNNPEFSHYKISSLDDNNFIALFWQSNRNAAFCIETFKLKKDEEVLIPKGMKPLSRQYFKGLLWIIAEKGILFK